MIQQTGAWRSERPLNLLQFRGEPSRPARRGWTSAAVAGLAGGAAAMVAWRHPRLRGLLLSSGALGLLSVVVRHARARREDAYVDEMVEESFPASDPPSTQAAPR